MKNKQTKKWKRIGLGVTYFEILLVVMLLLTILIPLKLLNILQ